MSTEAPSRTAQQVFISYRRQETGAHAGRIYDAMVGRFGEDNVFMDIDMEPGVDFVEQITEAVSGCVALIVVMGPGWATVESEEGQRRIEDPADFVRLEVETGLRRDDVRVIPALVAGARMPRQEALPPALQPIARRNALELSDGRWTYDVGRLMAALDELLGPGEPKPEPEPEPEPERPPGWRLALEGMLVAGAASGLVRVVGQAVETDTVHEPTTREATEQIANLLLRRTGAGALAGLALALWLGYRLTGPRASSPWLRGLGLGLLGGLIGGAIFVLPVYVPDPNLSLDARRPYELLGYGVTGAFLGAVIGSVWRPSRVGAGLVGGAAGGVLFGLLAIAVQWNNELWGMVALAFAAGAAAMALGGLVAVLAVDRERRGGAG